VRLREVQSMTEIDSLFACTGVVAIIYGLLLLWNARAASQDLEQEKWLKSEEITGSRFNSFKNMRHLIRPDRQNISFSRSKGRAYAMLAIGLALILMAFT
jgi:hypothetical protein